MRRLPLILLLAACILPTARSAHADAVVTQCSGDHAGGADLAAAMLAGGLIKFNCPAGTTIQVTGNLVISKTVKIDGENKITLTGGDQPMFLAQQDGLSIELANLAFKGTTSVIVQQRAEVPITVTGSTFVDCTAPLGALNAALTIRMTTFTNCTGTVVMAMGNLTIEFSRFENTKGFAVFSSGPDTTTRIADTRFIKNSAGGILVGLGNATNLNTRLDIIRSEFTDNGGDESNPNGNVFGGVLYICNSQAKNCTINVDTSVFTGNKTTSGSGGAIAIAGTSLATIRASKFTNNSAPEAGGAISFGPGNMQNPKLVFDFNVFKGNSAKNGGAIAISSALLQMRTVTFSKNSATEAGGAISIDTTQIQITRGVFVENSAGGRGAAIAMQGGEGNVIANTLFVRNKATGGGAFAGADTRFINVTFADNTGSGILLDPSQSPPWGAKPITLKNTLLSNNSGGNCQFAGGGAQALVTDEGNNIEFAAATCTTGAKVSDPFLDTLYLPVFGSPAMAAGDNDVCLKPPVSAIDVYGKRRPMAVICTIGAAEGTLENEVANRNGNGPNGPVGPNTPPRTQGPKPGTGPGTQAPPGNGSCCCCR